MYDTKYHKPFTVTEALGAFADGDDAQFLAGGQTLVPTMKARLAAPSDLIDISALSEMRNVIVDGSTVTIGAAVTHAEVAAHSDICAVCPALCDLAANIGDPAVRNRGTLGGSIANNDPAACYPAAMLALGATIRTNLREIEADAFFDGMFSTVLDEGELVLSISFEAPSKAAYTKFPNPASRYAMCGVFVASGDSVRVAVTGAGNDGVFRMSEMENALAASFDADAIGDIAPDASDMLSDLHGDGAYRANLVNVVARRAVAAATG